MKTVFQNTLLVIVPLVVILLIEEFSLQLLVPNQLGLFTDERNLAYRYDPDLGWFPIEDSERYYSATRRIHLKHNKMGFRDHEHGSKEKPRIIFLGDSFVWGFDVEQNERFTEKLQGRVPEWEVINLGISGYATDQEYLLLKKYYDFYKPDIIFLMFCQINDQQDNAANCISDGGYFKSYFTIDDGKLVLKGTPVPQCVHYYSANHPTLFKSYLVRSVAAAYLNKVQNRIQVPDPTRNLILAMRSYVISRGAKFAIGMQDQNEALAQFLKAEEIPFV